MTEMTDIAIIGAGRLGTCLGAALSRAGHTVASLSCRSLRSGRESRRLIGRGSLFTDPAAAAEQGSIVFLTVPDEAIQPLAAGLAGTGIDWRTRIVFHCSGLFPSSLLGPLAARGARTASFHPVQSFPRKSRRKSLFRGIFIGLEGDQEAIRRGRALAADLGARSLLIRPADKPLYHAACSSASNLFTALLSASVSMMEEAGIDKDLASGILLPLVQGTLQNVKKFGLTDSLSGPIARGDADSLGRHLKALSRAPRAGRIYRSLAHEALRMAALEGKVPDEKIRALKSLLEGE